MSEETHTFNRGVVRPVECLKAGWEAIKGDYWLLLGITVVGILVASFAPFGILVGPVMCGIYYCLLRRLRGQTVKFEMVMRGVDHFLQSLIATLLMMIPMIILMAPLMVLYFAFVISIVAADKGGEPEPNIGIGILIAMGFVVLMSTIASLILQALFLFVYPLIVDRKLSGVEAIKTSFRAAKANFGGVIGLVLLSTLMNMLGAMACYVGLFFVMPIHFAAIAVAYERVFSGGESDPEAIDPVDLEPLPVAP